MLIVKIIENITMYSVQENFHIFLCLIKVIPPIFTLSIFSLHSSTNLSTKLFL